MNTKPQEFQTAGQKIAIKSAKEIITKLWESDDAPFIQPLERWWPWKLFAPKQKLTELQTKMARHRFFYLCEPLKKIALDMNIHLEQVRQVTKQPRNSDKRKRKKKVARDYHL